MTNYQRKLHLHCASSRCLNKQAKTVKLRNFSLCSCHANNSTLLTHVFFFLKKTKKQERPCQSVSWLRGEWTDCVTFGQSQANCTAPPSPLCYAERLGKTAVEMRDQLCHRPLGYKPSLWLHYCCESFDMSHPVSVHWKDVISGIRQVFVLFEMKCMEWMKTSIRS